MPRKTLTVKEAQFVQEYLVDLNATHAAIRAGYSAKTAKQIGHGLLQKPRVAEALSKAMQERSERTGITADRVLAELALIGFSDMGDYLTFGDDGIARLDWSKLPEGATKVISEITQDIYTDGKGEAARPVRKTKFKLHDKRAALVDIGRHLGMFTDNLNMGGTLGLRWEDALDELE